MTPDLLAERAATLAVLVVVARILAAAVWAGHLRGVDRVRRSR